MTETERDPITDVLEVRDAIAEDRSHEIVDTDGVRYPNAHEWMVEVERRAREKHPRRFVDRKVT